MSNGRFPLTRLRRLRQHNSVRELCQENRLSTNDLILPMFVMEGKSQATPISSMPGIYRRSLDNLIDHAKLAHEMGIHSFAIFPVIENKFKSVDAKAAWAPIGLIPKTIRALKKALPDSCIISDVALDPYTSHGQDGLTDSKGHIENDRTIVALTKQALCHAEAGATIVAPSDMMDGRIGQIRTSLENHKFHDTLILSYSAKYASSFYGPFRDAVGSKKALGRADKRSYQMNPANSKEALREIALDIEEGADIVMVKPGLPYLDIIQKAAQSFEIPIFAYNVSGEYSMIKAASANGWLTEEDVVLEALLSMKRAGASAILTYHALDVAKWLR